MTKFGVSGLPTLVLFKDGKELNRVEGVLPADQLMQQVRYWIAGSETNDTGDSGDQSTQRNDQASCSPPSQDACAPPPINKDVCPPPFTD